MEEQLHEFEKQLGFTFNNSLLLKQALTHRSYLNEQPEASVGNNERLEYFGDAILDFVVAEVLFRRYTNLHEGEMTNMRAALVRESTLAGFAASISLGDYLLMGSGEAATGGRERHTTLSAAFEALIAAIYLDQGLPKTRDFILHFVEPELQHAYEVALSKDMKSRLQEWVQGHWHHTPAYYTISTNGPDHAKTFTVEAVINGKVYGVGEGRNKQVASQAAAQAAMNNILAHEAPDRDIS